MEHGLHGKRCERKDWPPRRRDVEEIREIFLKQAPQMHVCEAGLEIRARC